MEKLNLNESKRLSRILAGKEKSTRYEDKLQQTRSAMDLKASADETPGLETKSFLFFFSGKFYFVRKELKKIAEADVKKTLAGYPETELYYICITSGMCPLPKIFTGRKAKAANLKNVQAVAEFITKKTGIVISKNEL